MFDRDKKPRWVLLRHEEPGGGCHLDWLIERPGQPDSGLVSFRVSATPFETAGEFRATKTPDHRRAYLEFEGEVSGGRGRVARVDAGIVECLTESAGEIAVVCAVPPARFLLRRVAGDEWVGVRLPPELHP